MEAEQQYVTEQPGAAVLEAIERFICRRGFRVVPKRTNESSVIFKWGVRVRYIGTDGEDEGNNDDIDVAADTIGGDDDACNDRENNININNNGDQPMRDGEAEKKPAVGWFCQADEGCRRAKKIIGLPRGFTSKACKHLTEVHQIIGRKTLAENGNKRKQDCEFEVLQNSRMCRDDPARMILLLETRRIVFHNLPFRFADYSETRLLNRLTCKPEFQVNLTPNAVRHTVVEMYVAAKKEVVHYLQQNRVSGLPCFSLVVDFWTSPIKQTKYLGVRVYLVDNAWRLKSVLLGTREFTPTYNERLKGMRVPFERWVKEVLEDFKLTPKDLFASTTDGGADVKRMMKETFNLKWQWCIPHLSNAATKGACGMHNSKKKSKNPEMQELVRAMSRVVYIVSSNEVMGSLWKDLCIMFGRDFRKPSPVRQVPPSEETKGDDEHESEDESDADDEIFASFMSESDTASDRVNKATKLLNFQSHRFMGLVRMIRSLLSKWKPLKEWFKEVAQKAAREKKPVPYEFPLKRHNKILVQLLSLLQPIEELNRKSQAEQANQVEVLLELYILRLRVLDPNEPLPHFLSTPDCPLFIAVTSIKPVVAKTRRLLFHAFERKFFSRYVAYEEIKKEPFVLESQLFLNPRFKKWELSLEQVVRVCSIHAQMDPEEAAKNVDFVCGQVVARIKLQMTELAKSLRVQQNTSAPPTPARAPADRLNMFVAAPAVPSNSRRITFNGIEDEIAKWNDDKDEFLELPSGREETILEYWRRKAQEPGYKLLPLVARVVYSAPTSSAQIERDFGISGMLVTKTRNRLSGPNIDMCAFINANRDFVDITQVSSLSKKDASISKPRVSIVDLNAQIDAEVDSMFQQGFSSLNVSNDDFDSVYAEHSDF